MILEIPSPRITVHKVSNDLSLASYYLCDKTNIGLVLLHKLTETQAHKIADFINKIMAPEKAPVE